MKKFPMTSRGFTRLQDELTDLKTVKRQEVIAAIAEARAHGDLKENAEYHAAKETQSFMEGRITEIESKLSLAEVIDVTKLPNQGKVIFGATISLINQETQERSIYQIVGEDEADIKAAKVSISSPLARALIGKTEGDCVNVLTPAGMREFEIDKVDYI